MKRLIVVKCAVCDNSEEIKARSELAAINLVCDKTWGMKAGKPLCPTHKES